MKRDASAVTAGSTKSRGGSFGDFLRGALATRASSRRVDGSGAPAVGRGSRRRLGLLLVPVVALAILAGSVATANAATQRPFKETFGSAAQPTITPRVGPLAVDLDTGDLLIASASSEGAIQRFKPDGTPDPFTALGSNVIDGKEVDGKPCAVEPASCDKTPENGMRLDSSQVQIAIDNSGGPTDGNIYVTQVQGVSPTLIDVFGSDGRYLGQITARGGSNFDGSVCGVTVDAAGAIYAATSAGRGDAEISKYVPTANPPVNDDYVGTFSELNGKKVCALATGKGPTAGYIFGVSPELTERAYKFDKDTGELQYEFAAGYTQSGIAVDPVTGNVLIHTSLSEASRQINEIGEFDVSGGAGVRVGRIFEDRTFPTLEAGFAFSNSGDKVYVGLGEEGGLGAVGVYGAPAVAPAVIADPASEITGSKALLTGSVDPDGVNVTECFFEYGEASVGENTATCEGLIPTDSEPHAVRAKLSNLLPNGHSYKFRLVAKNANGREESPVQTLVTATTVVTEAPNPVGTTTATLRGTVRPEGSEYSACFFEYGLASSASPEKAVPCTPGAAAIPPDFAPHQVSAAIGGLQVGESYRFRLVATNSTGTLEGENLIFTTLGKPRIGEIRASDADQSSVRLEAAINPSGFGTSYHFEWGATNAYGNDVPADFEPFVGSGTEPVRVTAKISGLSAGTVYHYRIIATNSVGTVESPDQILETLNSCGLPEGRCFELVSPREAGPVALPGRPASAAELPFQAAVRPGSLAYVMQTGLPNATRGADVLYTGVRSTSGWSSTQFSPPITAFNETAGVLSASSKTWGLSEDLSCAIVESNQPLTSDPGTRLVIESGGTNLYRRNPDGTYTAITSIAPENPGAAGEKLGVGYAEYGVDGFSRNCDKVVFRPGSIFGDQYRYPGVPGKGNLYEWDEGALRRVGFVPGPSGETAVEAVAGTADNHSNVVSEDGTRVFFSAERQTSANPAEIGRTGIFVRENGTASRDLSLSETLTPNTGATFQYATKDGSRVFFTANAGLTEESSPAGTDLYEYNLEAEDLTDLSIGREGSADVEGFIGISEDGSDVYFIAGGQLDPGNGKTLAENEKDGTASIYHAAGGEVSYAGPIRVKGPLSEDLNTTVEQKDYQSARVSPDGRYLLFESTADVTGYDSGNWVREVYLYDAEASSDPTICISCRQDGEPSLSPNESPKPLPGQGQNSSLYSVPTLVIRNGRPQVYFTSFDRLAVGGAEERRNVYSWSHGQVFQIATEPPGLGVYLEQPNRAPDGTVLRFVQSNITYVGASADATDLYFATPQRLTWEDGDDRFSVYDARIGGGFSEPSAPPAPCDPTSEGSCQGSSTQPATVPAGASTTFRGPGNAKPKKPQKRHKKHHKKKKHHTKHDKQKKRPNGNRRAGK